MRKVFVCLIVILGVYLSLGSLPISAEELFQQKEISKPVNVVASPGGAQPTEVQTGIYLIDFDSLESQEEIFQIEAYLFLSWKDPRLAFDDTEGGKTEKNYTLSEIWKPLVYFTDSDGGRKPLHIDLVVDPDGTVFYKERFSGKFSSYMNLRKFPFDTQTLSLTLHPDVLDRKGEEVILSVDKTKTSKSSDAFLTGWNIGEVTARDEVQQDIDGLKDSSYIYSIEISRAYSAYVWNVILPMLMMIFTSWTVFWSRSFEANTVISFSSLLSFIAFNIVVVEDLPKISYLTFMNGFILICYIFIILSIVQIVIKHYLELSKEHKIDKISRWLFPGLFFTSNLLLSLIFLH